MKKFKFILLIFCWIMTANVSAQKILPDITVKNFGGKIIVSWQNAYPTPVSNILIQRSYDSLKNYSSIGSVLNPQSRENGYADVNPPYTRMYYRVSISFDGGEYVISHSQRPVRDIPFTDVSDSSLRNEEAQYPWQSGFGKDSTMFMNSAKKGNEITYPSERIYTARDNNIVMHLADAATKKYSAKFYNESDSLLFELTKLTDEYLIIEKVNFLHAGWFHFEIYENGKLIEKNRFQILSKEQKAGNR